jgi:outer membrane protein TolC
MKHKILLLGAGLCIAAGLWAETTLDIDGAVKLALEKNLSLERSRIDRDAAKRKYGRSWNSLLPSLGAGVLASRQASVTSAIPAGADQWTPGFSLSASVRLSLSAIMNAEQAKADYEAGLLDYEAARQGLDFEVRRLYCQLLLLCANKEMADRNAESAQIRYEQIRAQYRNGQASNLDELSARLDAQTQATNVQSALTAYDNALDGLKQLLMISPEEKVTLSGSLQSLSITETEPGTGVPGNPRR